MDLSQKKLLLDKYWKAETSIEEESILKESFGKLNNAEKKYFKMLNKLEEINLDELFDEVIMGKIKLSGKISKWAIYRNNYNLIAASIVIVMVSVLLIFGFQKEKVKPVAMENDPRKAFEMTKQALMMISSRLNKGTEYTKEFSLFDQTKTKIKRLEN